MTVDSITAGSSPTYFGSLLFSRGVSGTRYVVRGVPWWLVGSVRPALCYFNRVVARGASKTIGPFSFVGYGSHCDDYGSHYMTAAASVSLTIEVRSVWCA